LCGKLLTLVWQGEEAESLLTSVPLQPTSPGGRSSAQRQRLEERVSFVTGRGKFVPSSGPEAPPAGILLLLLSAPSLPVFH
jgi:hypothetical protein